MSDYSKKMDFFNIRHEKVHLFICSAFWCKRAKRRCRASSQKLSTVFVFFNRELEKTCGKQLVPFLRKRKKFHISTLFHEKNTVLKKRRRPKGRSPFFSKSGSSHEKELKCETFCSYPQKRKRLLSPTSFSELSIKKKGREFSVHSDFFPFKILYKYLTFRIRFQASLRKKAHVKIHL